MGCCRNHVLRKSFQNHQKLKDRGNWLCTHAPQKLSIQIQTSKDGDAFITDVLFMDSGCIDFKEIILAMKYLRPDDTVWNHFVAELTALFQEYAGVVELQRINFPTDWASHMMV